MLQQQNWIMRRFSKKKIQFSSYIITKLNCNFQTYIWSLHVHKVKNTNILMVGADNALKRNHLKKRNLVLKKYIYFSG